MRGALAIATLIFGSGAAFAAPDQSIPLGPGSTIYWTSAYEGGTDKFQERLVHDGEDFHIYKTDGEAAANDPSDYFALFSGIYFTGCDTEMPNAEERAQIAGLWPLTPGASVDISTGDGAKYEVGEPQEVFLMGKTRSAHLIKGTYYGEDASGEMLTVLDDLPLTVGIQWDEGGKDTATLITRPNAVASTMVDTDLIGTCASLLNTQTDKN